MSESATDMSGDSGVACDLDPVENVHGTGELSESNRYRIS